jgi:hypothetical protein
MRVSVNPKPDMTVYRRALKLLKRVYVLAARKPLKYLHGRSWILYIGPRKRGLAESHLASRTGQRRY